MVCINYHVIVCTISVTSNETLEVIWLRFIHNSSGTFSLCPPLDIKFQNPPMLVFFFLYLISTTTTTTTSSDAIITLIKLKFVIMILHQFTNMVQKLELMQICSKLCFFFLYNWQPSYDQENYWDNYKINSLIYLKMTN